MRKIRFLVVWVGTRCTLRCKNCCNLIPYAPQLSFEPEKILENLRYITDTTIIENLQIQGGEPFTHKVLAEIIDGIAKLDNVKKIEIASNGTILPPEDVIEVIEKHKNKVKVRLSVYECVKSDRRDKIISMLQKYGIDATEYEFALGDGMWFDSGDVHTDKNLDADEVKQIYKRCYNRSCWAVIDDYLVCCGKIYNLASIKGEDIENGNNVVNLIRAREKKIAFEDVLTKFDEAYINDVPKLCAYCIDSREREVKPAIQL